MLEVAAAALALYCPRLRPAARRAAATKHVVEAAPGARRAASTRAVYTAIVVAVASRAARLWSSITGNFTDVAGIVLWLSLQKIELRRIGNRLQRLSCHHVRWYNQFVLPGIPAPATDGTTSNIQECSKSAAKVFTMRTMARGRLECTVESEECDTNL